MSVRVRKSGDWHECTLRRLTYCMRDKDKQIPENMFVWIGCRGCVSEVKYCQYCMVRHIKYKQRTRVICLNKKYVCFNLRNPTGASRLFFLKSFSSHLKKKNKDKDFKRIRNLIQDTVNKESNIISKETLQSYMTYTTS